jgi:hypothetical protein
VFEESLSMLTTQEQFRLKIAMHEPVMGAYHLLNRPTPFNKYGLPLWARSALEDAFWIIAFQADRLREND